MPVLLHASTHDERSGRFVKIGLINNMPDEALKATERQFISLLDLASEGMPIHLSLYTLPGVPRNDASRRHMGSIYANIEDLWEGQLDGLIVTGREPLATNLVDEPYWESFTKTLAWAQENAHSTIWSCLAAHAAILHLDGVGRIKSEEKVFGIFECARGIDHPLMARTPLRFRLPHSRWNGLTEQDLTGCGYSVLTKTKYAGVDTFIKQQKRLFVFFQGHPEYESDTLLREYRRDIGRYFRGETQRYPSMPQNYFDNGMVAVLTTLQQGALAGEGAELLPAISMVLENSRIENGWQPSATGIYKNWLRYVCTQKENARRPKSIKRIAELEPVS
jgi:homoserine O-succinyltransferase/O-acetyltransferase